MRGFGDDDSDGEVRNGPGADDDFALPDDTAEFEALGDLDLGSEVNTPLPPDDRLWRHPSEMRYVDPPAPPARSLGIGAVSGIAIGAGLVGALLAVITLRVTDGTPEVFIERRLEAAEPGAPEPVRFSAAGETFVEVAAAVTPAIAMVEVRRSGGTTTGSAVAFRTGDTGTALITNAHVVDDADRIEVVLDDGRRLDASLVGLDRRTDIATLTVDVGSLPIALIGADAPVLVGQPTLAVGSPLGLDGGPSMTAGVISGVGRSLENDAGTFLVDMIQTDAIITPGSSGGALVNAAGAVIGITTAVDVVGVPAGIAFATPIDLAYDVAAEILETGRARHAWLGLTGRDATGPVGVDVLDVVAGGPSDTAGLRSGDVVVAVDGVTITSMRELTARMARTEPGDLAVLELADGRRVAVVCGERPGDSTDD